MNKDSLLEMARGAIIERVNYEAGKVFDNIEDPNTDYKAKRKICVTLTLEPISEDRDVVKMDAQVKATLAPTLVIRTSVYTARDEDGCPMFVEAARQTPGQIDMDGEEAEEPKIVRLAKRA